MSHMQRNLLRVRAIFSSRHFKELFHGDDGTVRRVGEHVLADLRDFCFARPDRPTFSSDPLTMARRLGRREVFDRIIYNLNLDEDQVQKLMEIDDGE